MSRSLLLLTLLVYPAAAAAAPASDLKDPFIPAPATTGETPHSNDLRDPWASTTLPEPTRPPPAGDLRDPWASSASDRAPTTSGDLRNPWAGTSAEPVPQSPVRTTRHGLKDPWSSDRHPAPEPVQTHSADLRDPWAPPVQRPRRAR